MLLILELQKYGCCTSILAQLESEKAVKASADEVAL